MDDFDIIEYAKIAIDPFKKDNSLKNSVKRAVQKLKSEKSNCDSDLEKSTEYTQRIDWLEDLLKNDDELFRVIGEKAEKKRTECITKLDHVVKYARSAKKNLTVTRATVKSQRNKFSLDIKTVEEIYKKNGFTIDETDPLEARPVYPKNFDTMHNEIRKIASQVSPTGEDCSWIRNAYDFCAFISGAPGQGDVFRKKSISELQRLLDEYAVRISNVNDSFNNSCKTISNSAKKYVMADQGKKRLYDEYLRYHCEQLEELYDILKSSTQSDLLVPEFADNCIKTIMNYFPDSRVALAIYNYEGGLKGDDVYIPERAEFLVRCGHCQNLVTFDNIQQAKQTNRCTSCGKPLYKKCPNNKCGELVLTSMEVCPECGFVFANAEQFSTFEELARTALKKGDIDSARSFYMKAKEANPSEVSRLSALDKQISQEEERYEQPMKELRNLIAQRKFVRAQEYLGHLASKYPGMNTREQAQQINSALIRCKELSKKISSDPEKKLNAYLDILDVCTDFGEALHYLRANPPRPCTGFVSAPDEKNKSIILSWKASQERGVRFTLVRKEGKTCPVSEMDGTRVVSGTTELSFVDTGVIPGKNYSYALFCERIGVYSKPACLMSSVLQTVTNIKYIQQDNVLHLSWKLPDNCSGVKVVRTVDGKDTVISENARNNADDSELVYNSEHIYKFYAIYAETGMSKPERISVVPTVMIDSFRITVKNTSGSDYKITWSFEQPGVDIEVLINGNTAAQSRSDLKSCTVSLPGNSFCKISCRAFSGGKWIDSSSTEEINTYSGCKFNLDIEETPAPTSNFTGTVDLFITSAQDPGPDAVEFLLFVRTKKSPQDNAPWVSAEEAEKASDCIKLPAGTYTRKKLETPIYARDEEAYYLTMFVVYSSGGKRIISAPSKRKIARPLVADIFWKYSRTLGLFSPKLTIQTKANRPFSFRPELVLCYSSTDKHLISVNDVGAVKVMTIPEAEFQQPALVQNETIEVTENLKKGSKLFLFLNGTIPPTDRISLRWSDGFKGKV